MWECTAFCLYVVVDLAFLICDDRAWLLVEKLLVFVHSVGQLVLLHVFIWHSCWRLEVHALGLVVWYCDLD